MCGSASPGPEAPQTCPWDHQARACLWAFSVLEVAPGYPWTHADTAVGRPSAAEPGRRPAWVEGSCPPSGTHLNTWWGGPRGRRWPPSHGLLTLSSHSLALTLLGEPFDKAEGPAAFRSHVLVCIHPFHSSSVLSLGCSVPLLRLPPTGSQPAGFVLSRPRLLHIRPLLQAAFPDHG